MQLIPPVTATAILYRQALVGLHGSVTKCFPKIVVMVVSFFLCFPSPPPPPLYEHSFLPFLLLGPWNSSCVIWVSLTLPQLGYIGLTHLSPLIGSELSDTSWPKQKKYLWGEKADAFSCQRRIKTHLIPVVAAHHSAMRRRTRLKRSWHSTRQSREKKTDQRTQEPLLSIWINSCRKLTFPLDFSANKFLLIV